MVSISTFKSYLLQRNVIFSNVIVPFRVKQHFANKWVMWFGYIHVLCRVCSFKQPGIKLPALIFVFKWKAWWHYSYQSLHVSWTQYLRNCWKTFFFFSKMSSQIQLLSGFNVLFSLKSKNRLDWSVHRGSLTNPFSIWVFIQGFTLKGRTPVRKILQHANQVSSAGKWCNHLHLQRHHSLIICAHMSAVCLWTH